MDHLCRLQQDHFALITYQPQLSHCDPTSFRRLYDSLNHRAYQTAAGFLSLQVSIALAASAGGNSADGMLEQATLELEQALAEKRIVSAAASA